MRPSLVRGALAAATCALLACATGQEDPSPGAGDGGASAGGAPATGGSSSVGPGGATSGTGGDGGAAVASSSGAGGSSSHASSSSSDASSAASSSSSSAASSGAGGGIGCSLQFDGVNDYVAVPPSATLDIGASALTVEAWVYYEDISPGCMTTVRKGTSSSATYDYWLHKNIAPADTLFWASNTSFGLVGGSVVSQKWTHVAGVYDPGAAQARLYVDGTLVNQQGTFGAPTPNADELRIGIDWDLACPMFGKIDEVRLSSTVRYTADFVPAISFASDNATIALWHFDECAGGIAGDETASHDGTINGAVWSNDHP